MSRNTNTVRTLSSPTLNSSTVIEICTSFEIKSISNKKQNAFLPPQKKRKLTEAEQTVSDNILFLRKLSDLENRGVVKMTYGYPNEIRE